MYWGTLYVSNPSTMSRQFLNEVNLGISLWFKCSVGRAYNTFNVFHEGGGAKFPPPRKGGLSMTLNCTRCWGSSSGNLEGFKKAFVAITPISTLAVNATTCYGSIYGSKLSVGKLFVSDRTVGQKNLLKTNYLKKKIRVYNECDSLTFRHKITPDELICR